MPVAFVKGSLVVGFALTEVVSREDRVPVLVTGEATLLPVLLLAVVQGAHELAPGLLEDVNVG